MRKLNLKKIIAMGLITTSILAVSSTGASASWKKDGTGWWYQNDNGAGYKVGWMQQNGYWYYFDNSGYMKTGWLNDNGTWYYFKGDGSMVTGNVIIGTNMNSFASTGAWLGTTTTSNTYSNNSTLSAMDKINKNYANMKSFFDKNLEYTLSDSEFTKDIAIKLITSKNATECAGYVGYQDATTLYDATFGGYNGLPEVTSTKDVTFDGVNHYKVWFVGIIEKGTGRYVGSFRVFNNGYYDFSTPGNQNSEDNFNEKTFDKNNKSINNYDLI